MENYESFSYGDLADLQGAFDLMAKVAKTMLADGGRETFEYSELLDALYTVGNMISYGEETFEALCADEYEPTKGEPGFMDWTSGWTWADLVSRLEADTAEKGPQAAILDACNAYGLLLYPLDEESRVLLMVKPGAWLAVRADKVAGTFEKVETRRYDLPDWARVGVCPITTNSGHGETRPEKVVRAISLFSAKEIEQAVAELRAEGADEALIRPYLDALEAKGAAND